MLFVSLFPFWKGKPKTIRFYTRCNSSVIETFWKGHANFVLSKYCADLNTWCRIIKYAKKTPIFLPKSLPANCKGLCDLCVPVDAGPLPVTKGNNWKLKSKNKCHNSIKVVIFLFSLEYPFYIVLSVLEIWQIFAKYSAFKGRPNAKGARFEVGIVWKTMPVA